LKNARSDLARGSWTGTQRRKQKNKRRKTVTDRTKESSAQVAAAGPSQVGKRLDTLSKAYGNNGSGHFSQFMENLSDNIGLPKTSGYNYLDRYRQAVDLFPQVVIDAMLQAKLLPNKQRVIDGARSDRQIVNLLNGIRSMEPSDAAKWAPGLAQQIKHAAARIKAPQVGVQAALVKSECSRFKDCLAPEDEFIVSGAIKQSAKKPTPEQLARQRKSLLAGLLEIGRRCSVIKLATGEHVAAAQNAFNTLADLSEAFDREV
jgi:hypothetical protein